jgi:hypothetical protein
MQGGDLRGIWKMAYPYRVIAIIVGIIGFFLAMRPNDYPIANLTSPQIGLIGLVLLGVAAILFFREQPFRL